jgi:hypothetical protein
VSRLANWVSFSDKPYLAIQPVGHTTIQSPSNIGPASASPLSLFQFRHFTSFSTRACVCTCVPSAIRLFSLSSFDRHGNGIIRSSTCQTNAGEQRFITSSFPPRVIIRGLTLPQVAPPSNPSTPPEYQRRNLLPTLPFPPFPTTTIKSLVSNQLQVGSPALIIGPST